VDAAEGALYFNELGQHNDLAAQKFNAGDEAQPLRWLKQFRRGIKEGSGDDVDGFLHCSAPVSPSGGAEFKSLA
jgi:hypothetical protein